MIYCFKVGDFSPVLPITAADVPLLRILSRNQAEEKENLLILQADVCFYLERLSRVFTGDAGEFTPSKMLKMAKRLEEIENAGY